MVLGWKHNHQIILKSKHAVKILRTILAVAYNITADCSFVLLCLTEERDFLAFPIVPTLKATREKPCLATVSARLPRSLLHAEDICVSPPRKSQHRLRKSRSEISKKRSSFSGPSPWVWRHFHFRKRSIKGGLGGNSGHGLGVGTLLSTWRDLCHIPDNC